MEQKSKDENNVEALMHTQEKIWRSILLKCGH